MAASIGIRVYRFGFRRRGTNHSLPFNSQLMAKHPREFIKDFIGRHSTSTQNKEAERSWYFELKPSNDKNLRGYVRYGTFGFESNFVDTKTNKNKYRRQVTDVEEIPLFFDFWIPENADYGLVAFQSFQGRSCINLVMTKIREDFERESRDCLLSFKKLMPSDLKGSMFFTAPIKRVRLIKKKSMIDAADQYLIGSAGESINLELILSARRNRSLGNLGSFKSKMPSQTDGVIEYEGIEFDEAVAEIRFGNTTRRVGVFGYNSDAGVIDLTDSIVKGADGHPTFESLKTETTSLLSDFFKAIDGVD